MDVLDLKWVALLCLVLQNSGSALTMRYTMVYPSPEVAECKFNVTIMKDTVNEEFVTNGSTWLKLAVPSVLYTVQNSLQYFSMSQLSAPVFQVLCQVKIIATAVFSVLILQKRLNIAQWISIVSLSLGVALVQLSQTKSGGSGSDQSSIAGFLSVIMGCLTSGFSGVYFEMMIKSSKASIWVRNIQLSTIGIIASLSSCYFIDRYSIAERGFFVGYNLNVLGVILLQAVGGLIVAVVVKYADNILKGFATSIAIIVSCLVSAYTLGDVKFSTAFLAGSALVIGAVFLYGGAGSASQLPFVHRFQTKRMTT